MIRGVQSNSPDIVEHYPRSHSRRAMIGVAVTLALVAPVAGPAVASASATSSGLKPIAFLIKPLDNAYFGAMADGAKAAAAKYGVPITVEAASSVTDDVGQANQLTSLVASGKYGCYELNPVGPTNLLSGLVPVSKAHIPIVNIDLAINLPAAAKAHVNVATYIGTNNVQAGMAGGKEMALLLPKGAQVALIGGLPADAGSLERLQGFRQAVAGDLNVVEYVAANDDSATALADSSEIMRAHPQLRGFFTVAGTMSLAIEKAVAEAGKLKTVNIIGVDGIQPQLQQVEQGLQPAAVEQLPYLIGEEGVQACVALMKGKTVPKTAPTPVLIVTKANAASAIASYPAPPSSFKVTDPFAALAA